MEWHAAWCAIVCDRYTQGASNCGGTGLGAGPSTSWSNSDVSGDPMRNRTHRRPRCTGPREGDRPTRPPAPRLARDHPPVGELSVPIPPWRDGDPVDRDAVCAGCRTWVRCCFCAAPPEAMRRALRRIAELHSACAPDCPERQRLAEVPRAEW